MRRSLLTIFALLALAVPAWADGENVIEAITYVEAPTETVVTIEGRQEPTFSVFTLRNPHRLFVDLSNSLPDGELPALLVENGVVREITIEGYQDDTTAVTRVVIELERETFYDVAADGAVVRVTIDAERRNADASTVALLSDAERSRISELEAELQRLDPQMSAAQAEIQALQQLLSEREEELAAARARVADTEASEAERQAAATQISTLEAQLASVEAEMEGRSAEAEARANEAEDRVAELEQELAEATAEQSAELDDELRTARAEASLAQSALAEIESAMIAENRERAERDASRFAAYEGRATELTASAIALHIDGEETRSQTAAGNSSANEIEAALAREQAERVAMEAELERLRAQAVQAEATEAELERLRAEAATADAAEAELERLRAEAAAADAAEAELERLRAEAAAADAAEAELERLRAEAATADAAEAELERLRAEAAAAREVEAELERLRAEAAAAEAAEAELAALRAEQEAREAELERLRAQVVENESEDEGSIEQEWPMPRVMQGTIAEANAPEYESAPQERVSYPPVTVLSPEPEEEETLPPTPSTIPLDEEAEEDDDEPRRCRSVSTTRSGRQRTRWVDCPR